MEITSNAKQQGRKMPPMQVASKHPRRCRLRGVSTSLGSRLDRLSRMIPLHGLLCGSQQKRDAAHGCIPPEVLPIWCLMLVRPIQIRFPCAQCLVPAQSLTQKRDESLFEGATTRVDLLVLERGSSRRNDYFDAKLLQAPDQIHFVLLSHCFVLSLGDVSPLLLFECCKTFSFLEDAAPLLADIWLSCRRTDTIGSASSRRR